MKIERTYNFIPTKKSKTEQFAHLRLRVRWAGYTLDLSVGHVVTPEKWHNQTQRCAINSIHGPKRTPASEINRTLSSMERYLNATFAHFEVRGKIPDKAKLKEVFYQLSGRAPRSKHELSIFDVFDTFVQRQGRERQWEPATTQKINQLFKDLYDFSPSLTFHALDKQRLTDFVLFLRDDRGLRNSTIVKKLSFLKWFLNWATAEGYNHNMAYKGFSPYLKNAPKTVIFLEWDELMQLYHFEDLSEPLKQTRDVFCFCCFTGLRYSDAYNLTQANLHKDYIQITTIKTSDRLVIELNDYSREILERYKGEQFPKGKVLPVISNQKMNDNLKEICRLVGLDAPVQLTYYKGGERHDEVYPKHELITTHAGRRTFICNALALGISPETIMRWTGHSDYSAMKPYIAIADRAKASAMSLFNKPRKLH